MAPTIKRGATYEDLVAVPENLVAEIVDGDLYVSPRPAPRHAWAKTVLGAHLGAAFHLRRGGPGGWWMLFEPELHFGEDVLVPDIAGWRRERMSEVPDAPAFTLAPDWVCEVVSSETESLDRATKMPAYAREGIAHLWLANPLSQTVECYRLADARWLLLATYEDRKSVV